MTGFNLHGTIIVYLLIIKGIIITTYTKYHQDYYLKNRDKAKNHQLNYRKDNPAKSILTLIKSRSKRNGIICNLTIEDIIIPEICPYLGIPITTTYGEGRIQTNASVDRINPDLGYTKGNVQIISDLANRMKQDATPEQLIAFAKGILKVHSEA